MMPDSIERLLTDWKDKTDAATPAPWSLIGGGEYVRGVSLVVGPDDGVTSADAEFIAVSRTAMPKLLAAVESVLALCDELTEIASMNFAEDNYDAGQVHTATEIRRSITDALGGGDDAE
jgi:hypothetical protein